MPEELFETSFRRNYRMSLPGEKIKQAILDEARVGNLAGSSSMKRDLPSWWFGFLAAAATLLVLWHALHPKAPKRPETKTRHLTARPATKIKPESPELLLECSAYRGNSARTGFFPGALGKCPQGEKKKSLLFVCVRQEKALVAFDADSGEEQWRFKDEGYFEGDPAIAKGTVYFMSGAFLFAIDANSGKEVWRFNANANHYFQCPIVKDDVVYFGTDSGTFIAVDAKKGEKIWSHQGKEDILKGAALTDKLVIFGDRSGMVYALSKDKGEKVWSFSAKSCVASTPNIVGDLVYFGSDDENLYALEAKTGKEVWKTSTGSRVWTSSPAILENLLCIGGHTGNLIAFDINERKELWRFSIDKPQPGGFTMINTTPALTKDGVYFCAGNAICYALDPKNGNVIWKQPIKSTSDSSCAVTDKAVYFGTQTGATLYALDIKTGEELWTFKSSYVINSSPIVATYE